MPGELSRTKIVEAAAIIVAELIKIKHDEAYTKDADGNYVTNNDEYAYGEQSPAAGLARIVCRSLLIVADANGHYGCRLCGN